MQRHHSRYRGGPFLRRPGLQPFGRSGLLGELIVGGLAAGGPTVGTVNLQWGYIDTPVSYAQQSFTFSEAGFHMPGLFLRGDQNLLPAVQGQLLLEIGDKPGASQCFRQALDHPCSEPERRFLRRKLDHSAKTEV